LLDRTPDCINARGLKVGGGKQFVKPAIARLHSIFLGRASALPVNYPFLTEGASCFIEWISLAGVTSRGSRGSPPFIPTLTGGDFPAGKLK